MLVIHREFGCELEIRSQIRTPPSNLASNVWEKGIPLSALPCLEVPRQKRALKIMELPRGLPLSYVKQDFIFFLLPFSFQFLLSLSMYHPRNLPTCKRAMEIHSA